VGPVVEIGPFFGNSFFCGRAVRPSFSFHSAALKGPLFRGCANSPDRPQQSALSLLKDVGWKASGEKTIAVFRVPEVQSFCV
jgi:hypothetical protein